MNSLTDSIILLNCCPPCPSVHYRTAQRHSNLILICLGLVTKYFGYANVRYVSQHWFNLHFLIACMGEHFPSVCLLVVFLFKLCFFLTFRTFALYYAKVVNIGLTNLK